MIAIETLRVEASRLPLQDRAAFAAFMLDTLPPVDYTVADEEVARRLDALRSGRNPGLSTEALFNEVAASLHRGR